MKINLTHLSTADQVVAVMRVIAQRKDSGQKTTFSSDLLRRFKHHGFRTPKQRLEYFTQLHRIASEALTGKNVERAIQQLAAAVIWEIGDEADYEGRTVRIVDLPEDDKATIDEGGVLRCISRSELKPRKFPIDGVTTLSVRTN